MAGLADPDGAVGAGDDPAAEDDFDAACGQLRRGRPRVVPDGLLAGADRVGAGRVHAPSVRSRLSGGGQRAAAGSGGA
jgi:hypothetical protein